MLGDEVYGPATLRLIGGVRGCLVDYLWSSLRHYQKGNTPEWQPMNRVLEAFRLSQDRRGRKAYVDWLEARAENEGGKIDAKAMEAIRGGLYFGEKGFKDKLLGLIDKAGAKVRKRGSVAGAAVRAHGESEAERGVGSCCRGPHRPGRPIVLPHSMQGV